MKDERESLILVVAAQGRELKTLTDSLQSGGFAVEAASTMKEGHALFADHQHALVLVDMTEPDAAIEMIEDLRKTEPLLPILVLSDRGQSKIVARAIECGASDCLARPFKLQKLVTRVASWIERRDGLEQPVPLDGGIREEPGLKKIIGSSDKIKNVFDNVKVVTASDIPVIIQGQTGTGKELVARAIHYRGPRRKHPFFPVNCAAIPEPLLESELFGHERGAFTGAVERRKGKFELSHRGTLFLDEIGEMPLSLQAKILRVLEDGSFRRVGGNELVRVDVRIVSATNKDLPTMVAEGSFREDLYYRLGVFPIFLPSLSERQGDIQELAEYFLQRIGVESSQPTKRLTAEALSVMRRHPWPGNVRELQNTIKRAALLSGDGDILPEHLGLRIPGATTTQGTLEGDIQGLLGNLQSGEIVGLDKIEELFIRQALKVTNGNITEASNRLGVSRSTIYRKLQEYGVAEDGSMAT
jgi:DNA-binding NtrC family response regulator